MAAVAAHSSNAYSDGLVRAVICAGMYPNVAIVEQKRNRAAFRTKARRATMTMGGGVGTDL